MLIPYGTVVAYAGEIFEKESNLPLPDFSTTPLNRTGWLLCNGDPFSQSMFPSLFMAIGDIYGGSISSGRVKLPDYRGYFLRCLADDNTQDPGFDERKAAPNGTAQSVGSSQEEMLQKHSHQYTNYPPTGAGLSVAEDGPAEQPENFTTGLFEEAQEPQEQPPPLSGTETRPKNMYVYYIIYSGLPGT